MQIINTKPRSLDLSREVQKWLHYRSTVIFKIDIPWASLEKTIVMYYIVNSNVFYILFATNKYISGCVFSRIKRTGFVVVLTSTSAFLANIDHTCFDRKSIRCNKNLYF